MYCNQDSPAQQTTDHESLLEDVYHINRFPTEVLGRIFTFLSPKDRKNVRLVCQSWFDGCTRKEKIVITGNHEIIHIRRVLKKCRFFLLHLAFREATVSLLPLDLWQTICNRIRTLEFYKCTLETETMKSILLYCDNLQHLHIHVVQLGSFSSLKNCGVDSIVKRKLRTLEICCYQCHIPIDEWRRVFEVIYCMFPNVVQFGFGRSHAHYMNICKFSRDQSVAIRTSELSSNLANLSFEIFSNERWMKTLKLLSTIRLTSFIITSYEDAREDFLHLERFFSDHTELKSVKVELFTTNVPAQKSVLSRIVDCCPDLYQLSYSIFPSLAEIALFDKVPKLTHLSLHKPRRFYTASAPDIAVFNEPLNCVNRRNSHLQYLIVERTLDEILQHIFQHQTDLKTLNVKLHESCTDFGLTGVGRGIGGYSIKRLQNLEQLIIDFDKTNINTDKVLLDFNFPKLNHFSITHRYSSSKIGNTFTQLAQKMPLLRTADILCDNMSVESILKFCTLSRNLHHLTLPFLKTYEKRIDELFTVCPTLRFISFQYLFGFYVEKTYSYDPFTKLLKIKYRGQRNFIKIDL